MKVWSEVTAIACGLAGLIWVSSFARAVPTSQPSAPDPTLRLMDIRYGNGPDRSNLLDIFMPSHVEHPLPLIVWVHGGGWSAGDKKYCPSISLASEGFIVASANYRLSQQALYPAQIQDCKGAIRFLRANARHYHIDPARVGVWGASAGGHLVALLGTSGNSPELEGAVGGNLAQSSRVQAVCDWYGPSDLSQFADQAQAAGILQKTPGPTSIMRLLGGSLTGKKDLVRLSNPITFINAGSSSTLPPFLIMHGDKDKMVPLAQSRLLYDALKSAGANVQFKIIPGAGHGTGFFVPAVTDSVRDFFDSTLGKQSPAVKKS